MVTINAAKVALTTCVLYNIFNACVMIGAPEMIPPPFQVSSHMLALAVAGNFVPKAALYMGSMFYGPIESTELRKFLIYMSFYEWIVTMVCGAIYTPDVQVEVLLQVAYFANGLFLLNGLLFQEADPIAVLKKKLCKGKSGPSAGGSMKSVMKAMKKK